MKDTKSYKAIIPSKVMSTKTAFSTLFLAILALNSAFGTTLEDFKRQLKGEPDDTETIIIANGLSELISTQTTDFDTRIGAAQLIGSYKLKDCIDALISNIENVAPIVTDGFLPPEQLYKCVWALIEIGDDSIEKLTHAIGREQNELRLKLLSYALIKIEPEGGAMAHITQCLTENLTSDQRSCFEKAKKQIRWWRSSSER